MTSPEELVSAMTLEEKATLVIGDSAWTTAAVARLGIPSIRMSDGPHGVRRTHDTGSMAFGAHPATCFPTASCTSATWDPELLREMGRAIAREAIALDVDVVLGPGVNIKRSPLCGRNFEYFSEDPFLSGELAIGWIDGVQSLGVGASLKHFAANNQETRRMSVSADVDERTLREIYLPAFESAVKRARPWTVMCSYNRINGVYGSEHRELMTDVLRGEWGFDGAILSDWGAVHDRVAALDAGLDVEMPGPRPRRAEAVVEAVRAGEMAESVLDEAVARILRMIDRRSARPDDARFDPADHHALARRIAADGMVLLKNDGILPLQRGTRIAVIGVAANAPRIQGGGSSHISPSLLDVPLDEIERLAGPGVTFAAGHDDGAYPRPDLVDEAASAAATADVAIVFLAMPDHKESEGRDRTDLDFTAQQVELVRAVSSVQRTVVVLMNGSAVAVGSWIDGPAAVLEAWYAGQAAGGAIADILFGVVNPSGRLAETFPVRLEDGPSFLDFPGDGDRARYGEGRFVGYRWYDARRQKVMFPFGFGLSYTAFEVREARVSGSVHGVGGGTTIAVEVANVGARAGSEVVQVYVRNPTSPVRRPDKELRGFAKVHLEPGEARTVSIDLDWRAFAYWDAGLHQWVAPEGTYDLLIGSSSAEIHASVPVMVTGPDGERSTLTPMSPLQDWLRDETARPAALSLLVELGPILGGVFGDGTDAAEDVERHLNAFFGAMPISSLLEFVAPAGGPDPDRRMAELIESSRDGRSEDALVGGALAARSS